MGKKKGWTHHTYGGKQCLEIRESQNKIRNISRFHGSLQYLTGFVLFAWVFF